MRQERIQIALDAADFILTSEYLYFVTYKGLKVKEIDGFKAKLRAVGADCHVLKNRVIRKVAELNGMKALAELRIAGDTAVVCGKGDASAAAKVVDAFSKETKGVLVAKCGYFEGGVLSQEEIAALAQLPSKDALRAQLLGLLLAVPTGLVNVLNAKVASIVNVINNYKNKLENAN